MQMHVSYKSDIIYKEIDRLSNDTRFITKKNCHNKEMFYRAQISLCSFDFNDFFLDHYQKKQSKKETKKLIKDDPSGHIQKSHAALQNKVSYV